MSFQQDTDSNDKNQGETLYQFSLSEARVHQLQNMIGQSDIEIAALYKLERKQAQEIHVLRTEQQAAREAHPSIGGGLASAQPLQQQQAHEALPSKSGGPASKQLLPQRPVTREYLRTGPAQVFHPPTRIGEEQPMF